MMLRIVNVELDMCDFANSFNVETYQLNPK